MKITKTKADATYTLAVEGRLDTNSAVEFDKEISMLGDDANELIFDFANLEYISSAGLRILLSTHKNFSKKGGMTIINANENVMEVFEVTGFLDVLNIKE